MSEEMKNPAENKLSDDQMDQVAGGRSYDKGIAEDLKEAAESQVDEKFHPVKTTRHIHR